MQTLSSRRMTRERGVASRRPIREPFTLDPAAAAKIPWSCNRRRAGLTVYINGARNAWKTIWNSISGFLTADYIDFNVCSSDLHPYRVRLHSFACCSAAE